MRIENKKRTDHLSAKQGRAVNNIGIICFD